MATIEKPLAQRQAEKRSAKTDWDTDKKDWTYVNIPAENALGQKHDTIRINEHEFEAGQSYLVPPAVAETVNERLAAYARANIRIFRSMGRTVELGSV